jgi:hypothetical protein
MLCHTPGLFLFFCVPAIFLAQVANIRVDKDLVLVPVAVVDRDNRPVTSLERKNFRIFENKIEQPISSFLVDDEPLAAGLVFDTSGNMGHELRRSRMAASAFFKTANPEEGPQSTPGTFRRRRQQQPLHAAGTREPRP